MSDLKKPLLAHLLALLCACVMGCDEPEMTTFVPLPPGQAGGVGGDGGGAPDAGGTDQSGQPDAGDNGGGEQLGQDPYIQSATFGTLDGSLLGSLAHLYGQLEIDEGERLHLAYGVSVVNPSNSAVVAFVEVGVPGFAQSVSRRVDVPAGQSVAVEGLTPTFDFDALYGVVTPVVAEVEVSLTLDGERVDLRSESVTG